MGKYYQDSKLYLSDVRVAQGRLRDAWNLLMPTGSIRDAGTGSHWQVAFDCAKEATANRGTIASQKKPVTVSSLLGEGGFQGFDPFAVDSQIAVADAGSGTKMQGLGLRVQ